MNTRGEAYRNSCILYAMEKILEYLEANNIDVLRITGEEDDDDDIILTDEDEVYVEQIGKTFLRSLYILLISSLFTTGDSD